MGHPTQPDPGRMRRGRPQLVLASLVLLMLAGPALTSRQGMGMVLEGALTAVVLASAYAVRGQGRFFWVLVAFAVPSLAIGWLDRLGIVPALWRDLGDAFFAGVLSVVVVTMVKALFRARRATVDTITEAICVYLLLGIGFAAIYAIIGRVDPAALVASGQPLAAEVGSLRLVDTLYFSFVTLTTMGYGDITPASPLTQMLATWEAITGSIYLAVVVARLVALFVLEHDQVTGSQ